MGMEALQSLLGQLGGGGGSGGQGGGMGGMMGGGGGGKKGGQPQGGTSDHNAGKSTWEKVDALGNIADGAKDLRPAEHSEFMAAAPQPMSQAPAPGAQMGMAAPARAPQAAVPTNQDLNNGPPQMGFNDAQGQALDDYAAEELARRQRSQGIA